MQPTKPWYQSRILWVQIVTFVLALAAALGLADVQALLTSLAALVGIAPAPIGPEGNALAVAVAALVTAGLRLRTTQPLR